MKTLIFLDDERNFPDVTWINYPEYKEVIHLRDHNDFIYFCDDVFSSNNITLYFGKCDLNFNTIDFSFDHDLQSFDEFGKEWTGYTCLKYLLETVYLGDILYDLYTKEDNDIEKPTFFFHTQNPVGKENMEKYFSNFKQHALRG